MRQRLLDALAEIMRISRVRKLLYLWDKLWVRIAVIGFLSVLSIVVAKLISHLIPDDLYEALGVKSLGSILQIIANSMLSVTIFSLTVMVSLFRSASDQWTPRVHRLLMNDSVTQNVLSTLLGAYIYAIMSIILLNTQLFDRKDQVVLFAFTVLILILIVVAIVRWVVHLQTFGSLMATTQKVEDQVTEVLATLSKKPHRGGNKLIDKDQIPEGAAPIRAATTGYVQFMLEDELNEAAEEAESDLYVVVQPGTLLFKSDVVAYATRKTDDLETAVCGAIKIGAERWFEEDPRMGFNILGEIGSKALSPGINDPGTAIDVISRMGRLLLNFDPSEGEDEEITNPRIWIQPTKFDAMIEDGFLPIARDGSGLIEVQIILQRVLGRLAQHPDDRIADRARTAGQAAMEYADAALSRDDDLKRLKAERDAFRG